jgi:hypothetical protein
MAAINTTEGGPKPHPLVVRHLDPLVRKVHDALQLLGHMALGNWLWYAVVEVSAVVKPCKAALLDRATENKGADLYATMVKVSGILTMYCSHADVCHPLHIVWASGRLQSHVHVANT